MQHAHARIPSSRAISLKKKAMLLHTRRLLHLNINAEGRLDTHTHTHTLGTEQG